MKLGDNAKTRTPLEPKPIADFQVGLALDKQPWLQPQNAFVEMENARVFRGRLLKRGGYQRLTELGRGEYTWNSDGGVANANVSRWYHGVFTARTPDPNGRVIPESARFEATSTTPATFYAHVDPLSRRWIDYGDDSSPFLLSSDPSFYNTWVYDIVDSADPTNIIGLWQDFTNNQAGHAVQDQRITITWELHSLWTDNYDIGVASPMHYHSNDLKKVVGLFDFRNTSGEFSIGIDTDRAYEYDATAGYYKELGWTGAGFTGPFTGTDTDLFFGWPFDDWLVVTNNKDPVCRIDPSATSTVAVQELATAWNGGGNELSTCKLVMRIGGRLVLINTVEGGTRYPGRARFTAASAYETYDSPNDYIDAPTELGEAVTCELIGERAFVGFEKGWMELEQTGDTNAPLAWRPFISRFGAVSPNSTIQDSERLLSRSATTMQALDPNGQYYIDQRIPDLIKDADPEGRDNCWAIRNEDQRAFWWSYVRTPNTQPDKCLVATYDEENNLSWSVYDFPFATYGLFSTDASPVWDSLFGSWNDYVGITWDNARAQAGYSAVIAGGDAGDIYQFTTAFADDDFRPGELQERPAFPQPRPQYYPYKNIGFHVRTTHLAPYPGQRAYLGWIDVYAAIATNTEIVMKFWADDERAPYLTKNVDLTASSGTLYSKVLQRIVVERTANFHSFSIETTDGSPVAIDAFIPYFRPAGRLMEYR